MKSVSVFQKMNRVISRTLVFLLFACIVSLVISGRAFSDFGHLFNQQQTYFSYEDTLRTLQEQLVLCFNANNYSQENLTSLCFQVSDTMEAITESFQHAQFLDTQKMTDRYLDEVFTMINQLCEGNAKEALNTFETVQNLYQELEMQYRTTIPFQKEIISQKAQEIQNQWFAQIPLIILMICLASEISLIDGRQMVQRIVQPLTSLTEQTQKIPYEDTETLTSDIAAFDTAQEILQLTDAFCRMSETIRKQMKELKEAIHLSEKIHALEIQNVQMKMKLAQAQMSQFQSLINPHFLFNCLSMLSGIAILENAPQTYDYSLNIAQFLRTSLNYVGKIITLDQELQHIKHYISIQERRFGGRFTFLLECDLKCKDAMLPAIIFQPLVENSLVHGVAGYSSEGVIRIHTSQTEGRICLFVEDNGIGMTQKQVNDVYHAYQDKDFLFQKKTGLYGVIYSLRYYFRKELEMQIDRKEKGIRFSFFFPYETAQRKKLEESGENEGKI